MLVIRYLYVVGGFLFLGSVIAHIYVRLRLRPGPDSDVEDYYHEFEEQHPGYAKYCKWLHITLGAAALGVLLLFLGLAF